MAGLARGKLIVGDASGNPSALALGSANYVLTSDGTDVSWAANDGVTTINNNADNRIITGSGTANTLNGESGLTYDGSTLAVTGDANFDSNTLFVDASANSVGIGTTSPDTLLNIASSSAPTLRIENTDSTLGLNQVIGAVEFYKTDTSGAGAGVAGGMQLLSTFSTGSKTSLAFSTSNASGNNVERLRIDDSGNVGIGTSSPSRLLTLSGTASPYIALASNTTGGSPAIFFGDSEDDNEGRITYSNSQDYMSFSTATLERIRITNAGNVGIGTTSPARLLDVNGSGIVRGFMTLYGTGTNNALFLNNTAYEWAAYTNASNNFVIADWNLAQTRLTIDTSGRVGINRTPAISNTKLEIGGADDVQLIALEASGYTGGLGIGATGLQFFTDSTVRGKFDQTGEFLVNRTNGFGTAGACAMFVTGRSAAAIYVTTPNTSGYPMLTFFNGGLNTIGSITNSNNNATSYNTTSDYRLKENVDYTWDATTRLKQLKPARFNWISDETNTTVDGFLAHEVESIVPESIHGTKDATETNTNCVVNSEGNLVKSGVTEEEWTTSKEDGTFDADTTWVASHTQNAYQSIDHSKLVPLLVKTIQELEARITELENA